VSIAERFLQVGGTVVLPKYLCRTCTMEENNRYPLSCYLSTVLHSIISENEVIFIASGFGGLVVSVLASGTRVRGFKPGRSEKILSTPSFGGEVNPSVPCRSFAACKKSITISVEVVIVRLNLFDHFSPIIPPFTNRGLSGCLTWSASGDDGELTAVHRGPVAYGLGASGL
jgi:hypothetical protein